MKSLALVTLLGLAGVAGASETYRLFPDHHVPEEAALKRAEAVVDACRFSEMSRIGPSEESLARCNTAEDRLLALGKAAVPAVLQTLDDPRTRQAATGRLYDVLARVGDKSVVDALVRALERDAAAGGDPRRTDRYYIPSTLERIKHADHEGADATAWRKSADEHAPVQPTQTAKADGKPTS